MKKNKQFAFKLSPNKNLKKNLLRKKKPITEVSKKITNFID